MYVNIHNHVTISSKYDNKFQRTALEAHDSSPRAHARETLMLGKGGGQHDEDVRMQWMKTPMKWPEAR